MEKPDLSAWTIKALLLQMHFNAWGLGLHIWGVAKWFTHSSANIWHWSMILICQSLLCSQLYTCVMLTYTTYAPWACDVPCHMHITLSIHLKCYLVFTLSRLYQTSSCVSPIWESDGSPWCITSAVISIHWGSASQDAKGVEWMRSRQGGQGNHCKLL